MKKLTPLLTHQNIGQLAIIVMIVGLFAGKAVMSIGTLLIFINALFNKNILQNFRKLLNTPLYLSTAIVFFLYAISNLWGDHSTSALSEVILHLPFIAFAFGFTAVEIEQKFLNRIMQLFIALIIITAAYVAINYFNNMAAIHAGYKVSHAMWVPFKNDHIRYSVAVNLAIWFCYFLSQWDKPFRLIYRIIIVLLALFIHVLAAKTGILTLYGLIAIVAINIILKKREWLIGFVALISLVIMPILAYQFSFTFREKVNYTKWAFEQAESDSNITFYSDRGRIISYKLCSQIISQHPILGVGASDAKPAMDKAFEEKYGTREHKSILPHNHFLMLILVAGVLGLFVGIFFWWSVWFPKVHRTLLFGGASLIFLIPCMVEPMWEIQYGITIHIFFLLLLSNYLQKQARSI